MNPKSIEHNNMPIDRWHYIDFRDERYDERYMEWKYFNFIQKDIAGYIAYIILDPEQKTKIGGGRLIARIFKEKEVFGTAKKIPTSRIQFDALSAGVDMDGAKIIKQDSYHYQINGVLDNISWDLHYKQTTPSIEGFLNTNPGLLRWEKMNWFIKMPQAEVEGTIKINNKIFQITGTGYVDTNWGEIMPFFSRYEWGQYNDSQISFVFGKLYRLWKTKNNYFYIVCNNKILPLSNPKFEIKHKKWKMTQGTGVKIPSENEFIVEDEQFLIKFSSKLIYNDLLALKISPFLPKIVISEAIVQYSGTIEKDGNPFYKFDGFGFQEWSTKSWKKSLNQMY